MKTVPVSRRAFVSFAILGLSGLALAGCAGNRDSSPTATQSGQAEDGPASASENPTTSTEPADASASKVLVACFSATGNTKAIAQVAARYLDADFLEIEPAEPYTSEDLNYHDESTRASVEQNDESVRPALASIPDFSSYEIVLLGHPIWWGKAPRLICTLLESGALTGKTVAEFCTSGSSGIEGAASELKSVAPGVAWLDPRRFAAGASDEEIASWINSLGIR